MNIFILSLDPVEAAIMQCDKHVVKMLLESCQMLCTVAAQHEFEVPYKPVHQKHPCTIWVGQSKQNWDWMITHTDALNKEYKRRYNRTHKCEPVLEELKKLKIELPDIGRTAFAQAMPDIYKDPNPIKAYRAYYLNEKKRFAKWNHSKTPDWWIGDINDDQSERLQSSSVHAERHKRIWGKLRGVVGGLLPRAET